MKPSPEKGGEGGEGKGVVSDGRSTGAQHCLLVKNRTCIYRPRQTYDEWFARNEGRCSRRGGVGKIGFA